MKGSTGGTDNDCVNSGTLLILLNNSRKQGNIEQEGVTYIPII